MFDYKEKEIHDNHFNWYCEVIYYECCFRNCVVTRDRTQVFIIDRGGSVIDSIEFDGNIYKKRGLDIEVISERLKEIESTGKLFNHDQLWDMIFAKIEVEDDEQ
jgi:hypothetical protein